MSAFDFSWLDLTNRTLDSTLVLVQAIVVCCSSVWPFKDEGAGTITLRDTGGTDHLPFDAVGLPGFQFIQDPLEYDSCTHHSSVDVLDHARPGDLMQAAAIVASIVYEAANRPDPMPRKPLPLPLPPQLPGGT